METKKWNYHKRLSMASQNYDFCKCPPRLFLTLNITQFNFSRTPLLDAVIIISIFFYSSIMFTISAGSNRGSGALMGNYGLHSIDRTFRRMWLDPSEAIV